MMVPKIMVARISSNGIVPGRVKQAISKGRFSIIESGRDIDEASIAFAHSGGYTFAGSKMPANLSEVYIADFSEVIDILEQINPKAADWYKNHAIDNGLVDVTRPHVLVFFAKDECKFIPDKVAYPDGHCTHIQPRAA